LFLNLYHVGGIWISPLIFMRVYLIKSIIVPVFSVAVREYSQSYWRI